MMAHIEIFYKCTYFFMNASIHTIDKQDAKKTFHN